MPLDPRGGPSPAAQEVVLEGPFRGYDGDRSQWFIGPRGILNDCQNVDFLKGQIITRPGTALLDDVDQEMRSVTCENSATDQYRPTGYDVPKQLLIENGEYALVASQWLLGRSQNTVSSPLTAASSFFGTFPVKTRQGKYDGATDYLNDGTTGKVDITVGGSVTKHLGEHYPMYQYYEGCYMTKTGENDFYAIPAYSAASWTLTGYAGGVETNITWVVQQPLLDSNQDGCMVRIPGTRKLFVGGGCYGSVLFDFDVTTDGGFASQELDKYKYKAQRAVFYNNRILIATNASAVRNSATPPTWTKTSHAGRVAYCANGLYTTWDPTINATAGAFDTQVGAIYDMFIMRDVVYVVGENGIGSIQKTGNSLLPFRYQTLERSQRFLNARSVVVGSQFAFIPSSYGIEKFDGSSFSVPEGGGLETLRNDPMVYGVYDGNRRRVVMIQNSGNQLLYDVESGSWNRWYLADLGSSAAAVSPWYTYSGGSVVDEFVWLRSNGTNRAEIYRQSRDRITDEAGGAITWYATSGVLDAPSSRDKKSCNRIRVTYEVAGTSTNNITLQLFVDGGTTAVTTNPASLTINTGGATNGVVANGYVTFAPVQGQQFVVKVSGSSTKKVKINQIALNLVSRQEGKPT